MELSGGGHTGARANSATLLPILLVVLSANLLSSASKKLWLGRISQKL